MFHPEHVPMVRNRAVSSESDSPRSRQESLSEQKRVASGSVPSVGAEEQPQRRDSVVHRVAESVRKEAHEIRNVFHHCYPLN
ncbi:hypothetical protein AAVH_06394 [Aphelenchoides avenae]|nr:hypothetical protein AAVH_06394 [Aphelenchus avenae]